SLYALGIVAAAGTAWLFNRSRGGAKSAFILEMPTYKLPQPSQVARVVFTNTWAFLAKAGTTIFCLSVLLWALMYYPRLSPEKTAIAQRDAETYFRTLRMVSADTPLTSAALADKEEFTGRVVAAEQLRHSFAGRFGRAIEPAIRPLGYDWKMGVGLVGAFAAREVFVSTLGIVYSA